MRTRKTRSSCKARIPIHSQGKVVRAWEPIVSFGNSIVKIRVVYLSLTLTRTITLSGREPGVQGQPPTPVFGLAKQRATP
jgi:hypothetical protein